MGKIIAFDLPAAAAALYDTLLVAGSQEIYSLDLVKMNWTLESSRIISDKPKLRYGGGVAVVENRAYLFGGAWNTGLFALLP
jgi:hypothetical protein